MTRTSRKKPGLLDTNFFDYEAINIRDAPRAVVNPLRILLEKIGQERKCTSGILCDQRACIHVKPRDNETGENCVDRFKYSYIPASGWPVRALIAFCAWEELIEMEVLSSDNVPWCHFNKRRVHSFRKYPKGLKVTMGTDGAHFQFEVFKEEREDARMRLKRGEVLDQKFFGVNTQEIIARSVWCRCADFRLHTSDDWKALRLHKIGLQQDAEKNLPQKGSQFMIQANKTNFDLLRLRTQTIPLPESTLNLVKALPRQRMTELDRILCLQSQCSEALIFTVDEVLTARSGRWSQVFFGHITGCDKTVCLKLYDERLLPIEKNENGIALEQHSCFIRAKDLAQREESVYHRLREFQGSLIPHCYGFHTVRNFSLHS